MLLDQLVIIAAERGATLELKAVRGSCRTIAQIGTVSAIGATPNRALEALGVALEHGPGEASCPTPS